MQKTDRIKLIDEEQQIVNKLIKTLKVEVKDKDKRLQEILDKHDVAKSQGPEAYGVIVDGRNSKKRISADIQRIKEAKDELYSCRLVLECKEENGFVSDEELKVGLKSYIGKNGDILVANWKMDVCQHFLFNNYSDKFVGYVNDSKRGERYKTEYKLKLKRNIDTYHSYVTDVTHLFPLAAGENEKVLYDAFLSELADRRDNQEFQHIIFSIQKKQGEIIQLPYDQDMIVQGCAGSGKSMIMMHRLPILIYNNEKELNSSNMYIISPSETYIKMVDSMRRDLEITDLKMGTLNTYYDFVLSKYGINKNSYGKIDYKVNETKEQRDYIYGNEITEHIIQKIESLILDRKDDFDKGKKELGLLSDEKVSTYDEQIAKYILLGNKIISTNNTILKQYYKLVTECLKNIKEVTSKLKGREKIVLDNINREILSQKKQLKQNKKELENGKLGFEDTIEIENEINKLKVSIENMELIKDEMLNDITYFQDIKKCCKSLDTVIDKMSYLKKAYEQNSLEQVYNMLGDRYFIIGLYEVFKNDIMKIEDRYFDYSDKISTYIEQINISVKSLITYNEEFLDKSYFDTVKDSTLYYTKLKENIINTIYLDIMNKCGQIPNKKGEIIGLDFSPYIYLKIVYMIKGEPNAKKEKLISIDEAQGLTPADLKLIKDVNGNELIFNLYGDVKQHIENTKGVDEWEAFAETMTINKHMLMENYRNAREITEECNRRFDMDMTAINTYGDGVKIIQDRYDLDEKVNHLFSAGAKKGVRAIIVDNEAEAKQFLKSYKKYNNKIYNMVDHDKNYDKTRWNLMTAEQSKGLEFKTVLVLSGRMTPNKKYISYTRALNELYIYEEVFDIDDNNNVENVEDNTNKGISNVSQFFREKGLEVVDMRYKGGVLWVVGEEDDIRSYVDEAYERFQITGAYAVGKAIGYRKGCYFKTKK